MSTSSVAKRTYKPASKSSSTSNATSKASKPDPAEASAPEVVTKMTAIVTGPDLKKKELVERVAEHTGQSKNKVRTKLGYGSEKLVVCSVGGTSLGKPVLEMCGGAFGLLQDRIPDLEMILVGGPDISPNDLNVPPGVVVRGYVPDLHEHFAASDLAVVMGGGTTTIELTALAQ